MELVRNELSSVILGLFQRAGHVSNYRFPQSSMRGFRHASACVCMHYGNQIYNELGSLRNGRMVLLKRDGLINVIHLLKITLFIFYFG